MKKIISLLLLLCAVQFAQAQLLNKIKQKAQNAVNSVTSGNSTESSRSTSSSSSAAGAATSAIDKKVKPKDKIIFSNTRGGTPKTEFGLNETIYGRVLLDKPLKDIVYDMEKENEPAVYIPINLVYIVDNHGVDAAHGDFPDIKISKADYEKNYVDFDIMPDVKDVKSEYYIGGGYKSWLGRPLSSFEGKGATDPPYGKQEFVVNFGPNSEYTGSFYFTVNSNRENNVVKKRVEDIVQGMSASIASQTKLPDVFSKPSAKNADPSLSLAKLRAMMEGGGVKILKAVIEDHGSKDWNIKTNALGVPEYKITARPLWLVYKDTDGKCYYSHYYFMKNYSGGGNYGELEVAATTADQVLIDCENVK